MSSRLGHIEDNGSMTEALNDAIEFACHHRSCAPPPVGVGGSRGGSGSGSVSRERRALAIEARGHALRGYIDAKKRGDKRAMGKHATAYRRARNVVRDNIGKDATGRSTVDAAKISRFTDAVRTSKRRRTGAANAQRSLRAATAKQQTRINNRGK